MQMTPNTTPIACLKVDQLRKHMLLTASDMSKIFGCSRMTYYSWIRGQPLRKTNDDIVRRKIRILLAIMTEHNWPTPEVIGMEQANRKKYLDELIKQY